MSVLICMFINMYIANVSFLCNLSLVHTTAQINDGLKHLK